MVYKKGFDDLIRALALSPLKESNVVAVMIGEGDQWADWQALGEQLGVSAKLRWVGSVPKDRIIVDYNVADLLVMPSVSKPADGLNVCVLDAMSCAKPVVASTVAGNRLAVADGVTGLLVPEQSPAELAAALSRLVDSPDLRRQMGAAGRTRIEQELGWPHLAKRYFAHFERLAHRSLMSDTEKGRTETEV
jgi:glycosyltransferase involved in cell wall biosynthesis